MRYFSFRLVMVTVALLLAFPSTSHASSKKLLRYEFKKGDKYNFHFNGTITNSQQIKINNQLRNLGKTINKISNLYLWRVLRVFKDGSALIEQRLDTISLSIEKDGKRVIKIYVTKDSSSKLEKLFVVLRGPIRFRVTNRGKIVKVTGIDEIMDKIREMSEKYIPDLQKRKNLDGMIESLYGGDNVKKTVSQIFVPFPLKPVRVGQSWVDTINYITEDGNVTQTMKYRLKKIYPENIRISASLVKAKLSPQSSQLKNTRYTKAKSSVEIILGAKTGYLISRDRKEDVSLEIPKSLKGRRFKILSNVNMTERIISFDKTPDAVRRRGIIKKAKNSYCKAKYNEARKILLPLTRQGDSRAQFYLGAMYILGKIGERKTRRAQGIEWVRKSAGRGNPKAETYLNKYKKYKNQSFYVKLYLPYEFKDASCPKPKRKKKMDKIGKICARYYKVSGPFCRTTCKKMGAKKCEAQFGARELSIKLGPGVGGPKPPMPPGK